VNRGAQDARAEPNPSWAISMSPNPPRRSINWDREPPTPEQLADRFAAEAVKAILTPAPDGLDVLAELARKISKPNG
jgi:hypothetical protein